MRSSRPCRSRTRWRMLQSAKQTGLQCRESSKGGSTTASAETGVTMFRQMLRSKIHRATVTGTHLEYEGSLTIDEDLMEAAAILPYEAIICSNLNNGERFMTYAI